MGTAFGSWESWDDGSIHAAVKDVGSLDVDGWPDVVRRTFLSDRKEREEENGGEGGVGYIGIWHCSNREGRGSVYENLG